MTPLEEKLREILVNFKNTGYKLPGELVVYNLSDIDLATTSILALIEGEVRAEREKCAKVAETTKWHSLDGCWIGHKQIATAIRSSGEGK